MNQDIDRSGTPLVEMRDMQKGFGGIRAVDHVTVDVAGTVETSDLSGVLRGHRERVPPMAYLRVTEFTRPSAQIKELAKGRKKRCWTKQLVELCKVHSSDIAATNGLSRR